jgi:hypothetical protein
MTATRNFLNAPLPLRTRQPLRVPGFAIKAWQALQRIGQLRAAWELEVQADHRALANPVLARQLRAAAAECRRAAQSPATERSGS